MLYILYVTLLFAGEGAAFGDVLYLVNGRTMEGIVSKEANDSVIVEVGMGKVTIPKSNIRRIAYDTKESRTMLLKRWREKYFLKAEYVPSGYGKIAESFKELKVLRNRADEKKRARDSLDKEISALEEKIASLRSRFRSLNHQITQYVLKKNTRKYNAMVSEHNALLAKIREANDIRKKLLIRKDALYDDIAAYSQALYELKNTVDEQLKLIAVPADEPQAVLFLSKIGSEIAMMQDDFNEYPIAYERKGPHMLVSAVLNGRVSCRLLVDTGASTVMLSSEVGRRLKFSFKDDDPTVTLTLADGSTCKAHPVILKSVRVGDAVIRNVRAAVLSGVAHRLNDGLLGMSYLQHFTLRIDARSNMLTLDEYKGKLF